MELSKPLVGNHLKLLEGYEATRNKLTKQRKVALKKQVDPAVWRRVCYDLAYNANAAFLHNMFFDDTMRTDRQSLGGILSEYVGKSFGSEQQMYEELLLTGRAVRNGWVLISYNTMNDELVVEGIDDHNLGGCNYTMPIACLDMWEHAYASDFGIDKQSYFMWWVNRMNWENVLFRLEGMLK